MPQRPAGPSVVMALTAAGRHAMASRKRFLVSSIVMFSALWWWSAGASGASGIRRDRRHAGEQRAGCVVSPFAKKRVLGHDDRIPHQTLQPVLAIDRGDARHLV